MKKLIALLLSLSLLAGAVPAAFAAEPETPEEQPVFRMGIMGDHQLNSTTTANMEATISAMHYFADHGVDAVIDVGVPDRDAIYNEVVERTKAIYPDIEFMILLDTDFTD